MERPDDHRRTDTDHCRKTDGKARRPSTKWWPSRRGLRVIPSPHEGGPTELIQSLLVVDEARTVQAPCEASSGFAIGPRPGVKRGLRRNAAGACW